MLLFNLKSLNGVLDVNKIKRASRLLSLLFQTVCWVYPVLSVYLFFSHPNSVFEWADLGANFNFSDLSVSQHLVTLALYSVPLGILVLIYHKLAKLFSLYEKGCLFEPQNIQLIQSIGVYMIMSQMIQFIYQPLMTFALTFHQPTGQHIISLSFGSTNFATLVTGFVIVTASWIIAEAHQLKTDVQLTI